MSFWKLQEGSRAYTKCSRKPRHDGHGRIADTALHAADVCAVQVGLEGKFFLRDALKLPVSPHISPNDRLNFHAAIAQG